MTVWAYTVIRNESLLMPYWTRHYATFCDRMIVYDDNSTDGTQEIARAGGAEVRPYPHTGLDDLEMVAFANQQYLEARGRADWVVWVDADEFLFHPRLKRRLAELTRSGVTVPNVMGYGMIGDAPPTTSGQIYDEISLGFPHARYSKPCVVDPDIGLVWEVGKHGLVVHEGPHLTNVEDPFKLLHYRYLGRVYHEQRNARNYERLTKRNLNNRFGYEVTPGWEGEYSATWHEQRRPEAAPVC